MGFNCWGEFTRGKLSLDFPEKDRFDRSQVRNEIGPKIRLFTKKSYFILVVSRRESKHMVHDVSGICGCCVCGFCHLSHHCISHSRKVDHFHDRSRGFVPNFSLYTLCLSGFGQMDPREENRCSR